MQKHSTINSFTVKAHVVFILFLQLDGSILKTHFLRRLLGINWESIHPTLIVLCRVESNQLFCGCQREEEVPRDCWTYMEETHWQGYSKKRNWVRLRKKMVGSHPWKSAPGYSHMIDPGGNVWGEIL